MGRDIHVHSHPSPIEHWRHLIEIAAFVVAAAWGLYVFVYQERIKPASEPPELRQTFTVTHTLLPSGKEFIDVDDAMENAGASTIYIAGMVMNIYAVQYADRMGNLLEPVSDGEATLNRTLLPSSLKLLYAHGASMEPLGYSGHWIHLQPNTRFTAAWNVVVPAHSIDAVRLVWQTCFTKAQHQRWQMPLERQPDDSLRFDDRDHVVANNATGLVCYDGKTDYPL